MDNENVKMIEETEISENSDVNKIDFDYNGKHYCLEYTPDSIKRMEAAGFSMNDLFDKPQTRIEQLWAGAFIAHERKVSSTIVKKLYDEMKSKKLVGTLITMYNNTLQNLVPDLESDDGEEQMGNVKWTASR